MTSFSVSFEPWLDRFVGFPESRRRVRRRRRRAFSVAKLFGRAVKSVANETETTESTRPPYQEFETSTRSPTTTTTTATAGRLHRPRWRPLAGARAGRNCGAAAAADRRLRASQPLGRLRPPGSEFKLNRDPIDS